MQEETTTTFINPSNNNQDELIRSVIYKLKPKVERGASLTFSKDKVIKRVMELEKKLFMPKHVPKGTKEAPDNPDYRSVSQEEKDNCTCANCKFPFEYWVKKDISELIMYLRGLEEMKD